MIDLLVEARGGALLDQLFSVVTASAPVTNRLAGYFEKVLNVVFRRKSVSLMQYLDTKAQPLFCDFCRQLHNHSIAQSLRLLLLPAVQLPRDESAVIGFQIDGTEPLRSSVLECSWHIDPGILDMLLEQLLTSSDHDVRAHTSELLISIIELSFSDSIYHRLIVSVGTIRRLSEASLTMKTCEGEATVDKTNDAFFTSILSVLEVIVTQFCDEQKLMAQTLASALGDASGNRIETDEQFRLPGGGMKEALVDICPETMLALCAIVPRICANLQTTLPSEGTMACQLRISLPRLGQIRLKVVNLLEALLRLQHRDIDGAVIENGALDLVLSLFFEHQWNSLLHQSVMAICMMILESKEDHRAELQRNLVLDARLLERIMPVFRADEVTIFLSLNATYTSHFFADITHCACIRIIRSTWEQSVPVCSATPL
jgi:hypothetical protein